MTDKDPLFEKAKEIVEKYPKGHTGTLEHHLEIDYNRALRLLEQLEDIEVISIKYESSPGSYKVKRWGRYPIRSIHNPHIKPEMLRKANQLVRKYPRGTAGTVQLHLNMGYSEAVSLLEELERQEIISIKHAENYILNRPGIFNRLTNLFRG